MKLLDRERLLENIEKIAAYDFSEHKVFGSASWVCAQDLVVEKCYGVQGLDSARPVTASTVFRLASMTKPITAVATLILVERGLLSLDDPVDRYLPAFKSVKIIDVQGAGNYTLLGRSRDDAAGEAFDKVAKMLDLPYPGGPEIDKLAEKGDPERFKLPRPMMHEDHLDFSFSGLKTAVLYTLPKLVPSGNPHDLDEQTMCDLCAGVRQAIIDVLLHKAMKAMRKTGHKVLAVSGGVSCNTGLRRQLQETCKRRRIELILPPNSLTTDNAAMIAFAGMLRAQAGDFSPLNTPVDPNLKLAGVQLRK